MRPRLVFVHGVGRPRDAETVMEEWLPALADGARAAGHSRRAVELLDGEAVDLRCASYGDLFPAPGAPARGPAAPDDPAEDEALQDMLLDVVDERLAATEDDHEARLLRQARNKLAPTGEQQGAGDIVRRLSAAANALFALPGLRTLGGWVSAGAMLSDLRQVRWYLARKHVDDAGTSIDQRIRARIAAEIDPVGPTVVVAHSLGTVVAFETLHRQSAQVPLLVTLGSPLGMRTAVHPRLRPQPVRTPGGVARWLNFWDRDDFVTGGTGLERCIAPNDSQVVPESRRVDSDGLYVHPAATYLAQPAVAGPLVEALEEAIDG
ncbi:alpha/beta hydrolase [Streptomyces sp. NPDC021019]|uniref:alpha/beta hydrolase n=1 Tax=Streptomyces sp. NPDC021019 TaxID=3365108 RepID=UPI00378AD76D